LAADIGGLVANGEGTDGREYEGFRNVEPGPKKLSRPTCSVDEVAGGDIAMDPEAAGGLVAAAGGELAAIGPPSVLNSAHRGHFRFVFMCPT